MVKTAHLTHFAHISTVTQTNCLRIGFYLSSLRNYYGRHLITNLVPRLPNILPFLPQCFLQHHLQSVYFLLLIHTSNLISSELFLFNKTTHILNVIYTVIDFGKVVVDRTFV